MNSRNGQSEPVAVTNVADAAREAISDNNWPRAEETLKLLIENSNQPDASLAYNLALVLRYAKKPTEALEWFAKAIAWDSAHPKAQFERAVTRLEEGDLVGALHDFAEHLKRFDSDQDALRNVGRLLVALDRWDEARRHWQDLAMITGCDLEAELMLARIESECGAPGAAQSRLNRMAHNHPDMRPTLIKTITHAARGRLPLKAARLFGDNP